MAGKGRFGILMGLALLLAGGACLLVFGMIRSKNAEIAGLNGKIAQLTSKLAAVPTTPTNGEASKGPKKVLITKRAIPPGEVILKDETEVIDVPEDAAPVGVLSSFDELKDRIPIYYLGERQMITENMIRSKDDITRAGYLVDKGKRYVSMTLDATSQGVAGMLRIGDRVDIVCTYQAKSTDEKISKIVIQDMKVIDIVDGDKGDATPPPGKPGVQPEDVPKRLGIGSTVTFEVTPTDAERFIMIQESGIPFKLILRNYMDTEVVSTPGYTKTDLINDAFPNFEKAAPPPPEPAPAPQKPTGTGPRRF